MYLPCPVPLDAILPAIRIPSMSEDDDGVLRVKVRPR